MSEPNLLVILALPAWPGGRGVRFAARLGRSLSSVVATFRPAAAAARMGTRSGFLFRS